jgi:hypothetical protein
MQMRARHIVEGLRGGSTWTELKGPSRDKPIFVNLGSGSATLAAGKLIPTDASAQQLRGSPLAQAVNLVSLHVPRDLTLPPYSVTVVSK